MVLNAHLVHGIDQHADVVGVDVGRDAVAEVEDVPGAVAVARQRLRDAVANRLGALAQRCRIEFKELEVKS